MTWPPGGWQEVFNRAAAAGTDPVSVLGTKAVVDVWKGADYSLLANVTGSGMRAILSGCWYHSCYTGPILCKFTD